MTSGRADLINNDYLGDKGLEKGLQFFLKTEYTPVKKWVPPNFAYSKKNDKNKIEEYENYEAQTISKKQIADCVEACIGAAFLSTLRLYDCLQVLYRFNILEEYNFKGKEKYFLEKFDFDLTALPELEQLVKYNCTYRKLFRLSRSGIFKHLTRTHEMKTNYEKIENNLKPKGEAKGVKSELFTNSKGDTLFKNYILGKAMVFKQDNKALHNALRHFQGILQTRHLNYTFKNQRLMDIALRPFSKIKETRKEFERMEFLGDALIEVLTIFLARKVFVYLKKPYTPEMLHSVKVVLLSNEGLSRIFLDLKLHRFMYMTQFSEAIKKEIIEYMQHCDSYGAFKDLWWNNLFQVSFHTPPKCTFLTLLAPKSTF